MEEGFEYDEAFSSKAAPAATKAARATPDDNVVNHEIVNKMMEELSADQRDAATAEDQNILLIAPAGTGKTKTMTTKYVKMLASGVAPSAILVCTYTNAAAKELKDRISPAIKVPVDDLWIGTIHSIGLRIIRANAGALGLANADSILDQEQQIQLIYKMMSELGHYAVGTPDEQIIAKRVISFIDDAKNRLVSPGEALKLHESRDLNWAAGIGDLEIEIYRRYESYKRMYDMIDYSDMLYIPTKLIESDPDIKAQWRGRFEAILVDEYQDLSSSQIRMIRNLVDKEKTRFFAAADDDQAIYGWRGSDIEATLRFSQFWPDSKIMQLTDNYRTPRAIFDYASRLIVHNRDRHEKKVRTKSDPKALVRMIEAPDPATEKQRIFDSILDAMQSFGIAPERIAILCRSNRLCAEMATYLSAQGLEVNLHEGLPLNTQPVAALIAWMQLSSKADNPLMFERLALYPEARLSEAQLRDVEQRVNRRNSSKPENRIGPVRYLSELATAGKVADGTGAHKLLKQIEEVRRMLDQGQQGDEEKISSPFARVGEYLGIKAKASLSERPEDHSYHRFVLLADEMVSQIGLEKTLASLTTMDFNSGQKGINLTTMHGAKGLEYDVVYAPGWEEGEFPNYQRQSDKEIDEERRLAYVTITRARKMLVVSWSMRRKKGSRASPFVTEMGEKPEDQ